MTENTAYQAPESNLDNQQDEVEMTLKEIYFSFNGRIPRKVFWIYGFLGMIGAFIALFAAAFILGMISQILALIIIIPGYILIIWASLAIQIKRWHDRNKSGWWVFIGLVPLIGPIWQLVECGFLEGIDEDNKFGGKFKQ